MEKNRISHDDYVFFISQTANLVKADLPVVPGLRSIAKDIKNGKLRQVINNIAEGIESGKTVNEAFAVHRDVFPEFFISMLKAGEASGNMGEILNNLAVYSGKINRLHKKLKEIIVYPLILLSFAIMISAFIFSRFLSVVKDFTESLPPKQGSDTLFSLLSFTATHWIKILLAIIIMAIMIIAFMRKNKGPGEKTKLSLPVYGKILGYACLSRFSRNLSILLTSGVPFNNSIRLAGETSGSHAMKKAAEEIAEAAGKGRKWPEVFEKYTVFPATFIWMVKTGENTGEMVNMLSSMADFYEEEFDRQINIFIHFIEPVIILMLGLLIGIMAVALIWFGLGGILGRIGIY